MHITFDPEADAIYVKIAAAQPGAGETTVNDDGVIVDTDVFEVPRGYELLGVRYDPEVTRRRIDGLPDPVRGNLERFIHSGLLESESFVARDYP